MTNLAFDFTGRSVIVTGAARGVGRAIGEPFRGAGATVYLVDYDGDAIKAAERETGGCGAHGRGRSLLP
jgi:3-oxoacyl-[acyl-carrier protein] reductase